MEKKWNLSKGGQSMSSPVSKSPLANNKPQPAHAKILLAYSLIAALAWTMLVAVSWRWNARDQNPFEPGEPDRFSSPHGTMHHYTECHSSIS